ncbi:hypothetical protein GCM10027446_12870 [Angustibacter peucedani]
MARTTVVVGLALVGAGIALVPLPGPGTPILVIGLLVVAAGVALLVQDRRETRS